jgi:hypothetical protein
VPSDDPLVLAVPGSLSSHRRGTTRTLLAPHTFHGQLYALAVTGLLRSSLMCGGESQEKAGYLANQLPC